MFLVGEKCHHSPMYWAQKPVNVCRIYSNVLSVAPRVSRKVLTLTESFMWQGDFLNRVMKILMLYRFQAVLSFIKECSLWAI